ncbi:MAG: DNA polymerase III subunit gamma/tau [Myxococcota bacterium]
MSYLVLARRYRPQTFQELVGQEHIVTILTNALKSKRIHHAFLFTGARGTGKTSTARLLAKALNCVEGPTSQPCNQCSHCQDITNGKDVDVLEIDGATNTGVENVRNLREDIRYLPSGARNRIIIIDEVHMLTISAFNALLKTLEEPPEHIVFIFATTEPHKIPATILSRVQRFDFKRVKLPALTEHVLSVLEMENFSITKTAARLVAIEGQGSVRDTLSILDQVLANHDDKESEITTEEIKNVLGIVENDFFINLIQAVVQRNGNKIFSILNQVFYDGYDLVHFAKSLAYFTRDLLVVKTCDDPEPLLTTSTQNTQELSNLTTSTSTQHLYQIFNHLFRNLNTISRSLSPKNSLEMVLMELVLIEPLLPVADLVNKLDALEHKTRKDIPAKPLTEKKKPELEISADNKKTKEIISNKTNQTTNVKQQKSAVKDTSSSQDTGHYNHILESNSKKQTKSSPDKIENLTSAKKLTAFTKSDWDNILDIFRRKDPLLLVHLEHFRFKKANIDNNRIVLQLDLPSGFDLSLQHINDNRRSIEKKFSNELSVPVKFEISETTEKINWKNIPEGKPANLSQVEASARNQVIKEKNIEESIKNNKLARLLIDNFEGKIISQKKLDQN